MTPPSSVASRLRCRLYDIKFQHKPWSTFGDAELIAPYNPLRRVPTLVLDDGATLIDSTDDSRLAG